MGPVVRSCTISCSQADKWIRTLTRLVHSGRRRGALMSQTLINSSSLICATARDSGPAMSPFDVNCRSSAAGECTAVERVD
jgi:hypothetical protein